MAKDTNTLQEIICFTHIFKTAGTSFSTNFISENFSENEIYHFDGYLNFFFKKKKGIKVIKGHSSYGVHLLFPSAKFKYITFLRDPVDRAISLYYFVKQEKHRNSFYQLACNMSLGDFYLLPYMQNWQTRALAGFIYNHIYPHCKSQQFDDFILKKGLDNLKNKYTCFGLLENYDESIDIFKKKLGLSKYKEIAYSKKTFSRPLISDLDKDTLNKITEGNRLDIKLYESAKEFFPHQ